MNYIYIYRNLLNRNVTRTRLMNLSRLLMNIMHRENINHYKCRPKAANTKKDDGKSYVTFRTRGGILRVRGARDNNHDNNQ